MSCCINLQILYPLYPLVTLNFEAFMIIHKKLKGVQIKCNMTVFVNYVTLTLAGTGLTPFSSL